MRTLLNIIWLALCGFWLAVGYIFAGILCCVLIVTIPFGLASFRIASFVLWPFGRTVIPRSDSGAASCAGNAIWAVVAGIPLAFCHLVTAFVLAVTIVGIPLAIANIKMIPVTCFPFGKQVVPISSLGPKKGPVFL